MEYIFYYFSKMFFLHFYERFNFPQVAFGISLLSGYGYLYCPLNCVAECRCGDDIWNISNSLDHRLTHLHLKVRPHHHLISPKKYLQLTCREINFPPSFIAVLKSWTKKRNPFCQFRNIFRILKWIKIKRWKISCSRMEERLFINNSSN